MSLIRNIEVQHQGTTTNYDIGADAANIAYDSSHSVKDKIDGLGTAAAKDVPASGDAAATEVVMGNDSRLTDSRNAADVSAWAKAASKPTYTASEVGAIATTEKGAVSGVAELDANGKVPSSQLPSYVDDVLEYASASAFPATGETGKIYVTLDTNKTYRWGGSAYVEISESLAIGTTSSTAFAGDRGLAIEEKIPSTASSSNKLATASDIPTVGTAAAKNVPVSGNASATEVVMGNDTRLTDARVASNISYTSTDPGAGSALTTGNIVLVYEP